MAEAYRIGVHLAMTNGVSDVLGVVARQMLGFHGDLDKAAAKANALKVALTGLAGVAIGGAMLAGVAAAVRGGAELVNQQALLRAAGEDNRAIAEATGVAWQTAAQVMGTTASGNLRALGELRGLLGSLPEAQAVLPRFQEFSRVLGVVTGQNDEGAAGIAAKMLDLRGAIRFENGRLDEGRFGGEMDQFQRAVITNRGRVSPQALLNFMQQAGPAGSMLTAQNLYADMSTLIESMGGHRAGTALAASNRQLGNGVMPERNLRFLQSVGLIAGGARTRQLNGQDRREDARGQLDDAEEQRAQKRAQVQVTPASHVLVNPSAVAGHALLMRDPTAWFDQHLAPAMERAGAKTEEARLAFIGRAFSTSTGQRFWTQIMLSRQQIDRERGLQANVPQDAARTLLTQSYTAAGQNLEAAWKKLGEALGGPMVPMAVRAMNALAGGIGSVADAVRRYPNVAATIGLVATGLGAALVVIGGLAIGAAAFAALGPVAPFILAAGAGIGALVAGVMALTRVDWTAAGGLFATWGRTLWQTLFVGPYQWFLGQVMATDWLAPWRWLRDRLAEASTWLRERTDAVVAIIAGWSPSLAVAIETFRTKASEVAAAIVDWITGLPGKVMSAIGGALAGTGTGSDRPADAPRTGTLGGRNPAGGYYGDAPVDPDAPARRSSFVPPPPSANDGTPIQINLDGRRVGEGIIPHVSRAMLGPAQAAARTDGNRALRWV